MHVGTKRARSRGRVARSRRDGTGSRTRRAIPSSAIIVAAILLLAVLLGACTRTPPILTIGPEGGTVTIAGSRARDGSMKAAVDTVTLPGGQRLFGAQETGQPSARSTTGTPRCVARPWWRWCGW